MNRIINTNLEHVKIVNNGEQLKVYCDIDDIPVGSLIKSLSTGHLGWVVEVQKKKYWVLVCSGVAQRKAVGSFVIVPCEIHVSVAEDSYNYVH